ncbi:MAG: phage tail sheath C-terminal domain-containing protein [bacterium]
MAEFVFTSPGVKFRERDLTFVTRNVGVTTLGVVGETQKGPAFEPVFVQDAEAFRTRFGLQSSEKFPNGDLKYHMPYVANAYLEESSQLYVTRVLGLDGYDAGTGWAIVAEAGVDLSTTGETTSSSFSDGFSGFTYLGETIGGTGTTFTVFTGFTKDVNNDTFSGVRIDFSATTLNNDGSGTIEGNEVTITGSSYEDYEDMVLAILRSRAIVDDAQDVPSSTEFDANLVSIISNNTTSNSGNLFAKFTIRAQNTDDGTQEEYIVSLDPNSREFLPNVLGTQPKGNNAKLWVEAIFPDLIKKLDADGLVYGIRSTLLTLESDAFTDYKQQYQTPETPWVVSELRGNMVQRLFKFISISDGDAANEEIKISITNIDPLTGQFDVLIRDFTDTDSNIIVLESFTNCTMRKGELNYIGNRIGTSDGNFDLNSSYVMLEINDDAELDSFPAGFEGYEFKDFSESETSTSSGIAGKQPKIFYNTEYEPDDRISRVYLGISENGYNGDGLQGNGINPNMFRYKGQGSTLKTKGFHMDSGATAITGDTQFEAGAAQFRTFSDVNDTTSPYNTRASRKFTLVPSGGFDGWNAHRIERSYGDLYRPGGPFDGVSNPNSTRTDFVAWETAINTFSNPEEVTINLFTTPGLNWLDNNLLVKETIRMIEEDRSDSLYIIDSPNLDNPLTIGVEKPDVIAARDIVSALQDAEIDSNYSATYYPWIQIRDSVNNINVFVPPTGEVVKAMAFTDNVKFPWFAPAGLQRGVTDARKSRYKMSLDARDILYNGRINPMADFAGVGTAIFGQKTLQQDESALDRINVRRLLLQLKVLISNIAIRLVFEQNDQTTIDQFLAKANPILDTVRRERGVQEFRIKMDDSINTPESRDRNELFGEIFIKPTRAVEFIGITFTITPSGASFDDLEQ